MLTLLSVVDQTVNHRLILVYSVRGRFSFPIENNSYVHRTTVIDYAYKNYLTLRQQFFVNDSILRCLLIILITGKLPLK